MPPPLIFGAVVIGVVGGSVALDRYQQRARDEEREAARKQREEAARKREEERIRNNERVASILAPVNTVINQPITSQRIIVGEPIVAGVRIFADNAGPYVVESYVLAGHECENIIGMNLSGVNVICNEFGYAFNEPFMVSTENYTRFYLRVSPRLGTLDQPIDPIIKHRFPQVPSSFRQLGHCVVTCQYFNGSSIGDSADTEEAARSDEESDKVWAEGREPLFRVRGLKVFDPRDLSQSPTDSSTWKWTRNAALLIAGVMQHRLFATNITYDDFDFDALSVAANECDLRVSRLNGDPIKKYTIDGVIQTGESPLAVIQGMLQACNGRLYHVAGKYILDIAGVREVEGTIGDRHILGNINYQSIAGADSEIRVVRAEFLNDEILGQLTDAPVVEDTGTTVGDRGSNQGLVTMNLGYTRNVSRAQYLMRTRYKYGKYPKLLSVPVSAIAIKYLPGSIINVSSKRFPYIDGLYEMTELLVDRTGSGFIVSLREFNNEIFLNTPDLPEQSFNNRGIESGQRIAVANLVVEEILTFLNL